MGHLARKGFSLSLIYGQNRWEISQRLFQQHGVTG